MQKEKKKKGVLMNIKVPSGKSTVIIVGQEPQEKQNKLALSRMDNLERKLEQQYKRFTDKGETKNYAKELESMQKSFTSNLNKFMAQSRQSITSQNNKLLEALKKTVNQKVQVIKSEPKSVDKSFIKKLDSLEDAIRKISLKPKVVTVNKTPKLDGAFEKLFEKMERLIKEAKPRMYPSPS